MTKPVTKAETLVTDDGVPIEAVHLAGDSRAGFVVAHGFTQSWQRQAVWQVVTAARSDRPEQNSSARI